MGRSTPSSYAIPAEAAGLAEPLVVRADLAGTIDLEELFGRRGPIEIEVGFGKGRFLLDEAASRPETLFLGIERAAPYVRTVRILTLQRCLGNVRLLSFDARDILRRLLPPASIEVVHVLFPDPWPKRRHVGRRIVQTDFIESAVRVLRVGGLLNIVTDHDDYGAWIKRVVDAVSDLERLPTCALGEDLTHRTHFADRMAARGATFQARTWQRIR